MYLQGGKKGKSKKRNKKIMKSRKIWREKKEWYVVKCPSLFPNNVSGKTLIAKSSEKESYLGVIGRRHSVSQADLTGENDAVYRKFVFKIGKIVGRECTSFFDGMVLTSDKQKAIVKKWHTLIDAQKDILAKDGSILRIFVMAVTKRTPGNIKKTCYAKSSEVKRIREIMRRTIEEELYGCDFNEIMKKLSSEVIGKEIEKKGSEVFQLQNCCVRKVKVIDNCQFDDPSKKKKKLKPKN